MRMYGQTKIMGIRSHFDCQRDFCDQLASVLADNAGTENPVRLRIEQHLGEALIATQSQ